MRRLLFLLSLVALSSFAGTSRYVDAPELQTKDRAAINVNFSNIDKELSKTLKTYGTQTVTGDLIFSKEFGYKTHYDSLVGGELVPDIQYRPASNKLYLRSIMLNENDDTVDVAIRRFNGTWTTPVGLSQWDYLGNIYFQPFGTDGTFNPPYESPRYGRCASITSQITDTPTADSRPGNLIFMTTPKNDNVTRQRVFVASDGTLVALGGANYEWDLEDTSSSRSINTQINYGSDSLSGSGPGSSLIAISPINTSTRTAIGIRSFFDLSSGLDIDYSTATDSSDISNYSGSVKTKVISIQRTDRNMLFHKVTAGSANVGMEFAPDGTFRQTTSMTSDGPGVQFINSNNGLIDGYRFVSFRSSSTVAESGTITYVAATKGVAYNITSDERLKTNIKDATLDKSLINNIRIRQFDWKETGYHTGFGIIAQELYRVYPDAVKKGGNGTVINDDTWGVDYSKLVPLLVKEVQDLRKKVEALELKSGL
jgi:hypothetical protein